MMDFKVSILNEVLWTLRLKNFRFKMGINLVLDDLRVCNLQHVSVLVTHLGDIGAKLAKVRWPYMQSTLLADDPFKSSLCSIITLTRPAMVDMSGTTRAAYLATKGGHLLG